VSERPWNRYHLREYSPAELRSVLFPILGEVSLFGVTGTDELVQLERRRVSRLRKLARLDPLRLRYVLPESITRPLLRLVARKADQAEGTARRFVDEDVWHTTDGIDGSLHLLAVVDVA
jgi:hypothetical protein